MGRKVVLVPTPVGGCLVFALLRRGCDVPIAVVVVKGKKGQDSRQLLHVDSHDLRTIHSVLHGCMHVLHIDHPCASVNWCPALQSKMCTNRTRQHSPSSFHL